MALSKEITTNRFGVDILLPNSYIVIKAISFSKEASKVIVETYTDSTKSYIVKVVEINMLLTIDDENIYAQAYEYLKTLDEYSNAIDC